MTKLRKQRRRKVFRHSVNRKRLRNKIFSVGNIGCKQVKNAWETKKSVETNFKEMGLSNDPNKSIKIPNTKKEFEASLKSSNTDWKIDDLYEKPATTKSYVMEALEAEAKEPRPHLFRLPKSQVERITYLMKKYGNDYKAMAKDRRNFNQETWKQIRAKIKRFKNIPEQYNKYLMDTQSEAAESDGTISSDEELTF